MLDSISYTNNEALKFRALELATTPTSLSHELRTELAAICWMQKYGTLDLEDVQTLAAKSCHKQTSFDHQPNKDALKVPVYEVANRIWTRLERLAGGEVIPLGSEPPHLDNDSASRQAYDTWLDQQCEVTTQWLAIVMADLEYVMQKFWLSSQDIAPTLPTLVRERIEYAKLLRVFDGAPAIGAALFDQPCAPAGGLTIGFGSQSMWAADAFARAVRNTVASLEAAVGRNDTQEAEILKGILELWLTLLKGYVDRGTITRTPLVYLFDAQPAVAERVTAALTGGAAALERHENVVAVTTWRGASSADSSEQTDNAISAANLAQRVQDMIAALAEKT